jgi:hypothetical protein
VFRAAGKTEVRKENIRDWLKPGFPFMTEEEIAAAIFFYLF